MKHTFRRKLLFIATLIVLTSGIPEPSKYPQNYFRSPVGFPILLSGSFGEIRRNHLHSGIDIRTEGTVGKPVYAIADGYVSRVFVSPAGFGKALYIAHPNGYTSVYGHLQGFAGQTAIWVRSQQYKNENFELDVAVDKNLIKVKKGDIVAYSGNAGSSAGPHLHFEIRDSETQETINPSLFGMPIADGIPPSITGIRIYPKGENSLVNFSNKEATLTPILTGGIYTVKEKDTVKVSGNVIFALKAYDFINGNGIKTGINEIDLYVDTAFIFSQKVDRFPFMYTRYVNSMIDYADMLNDNSKYLLSYVVPSNKLPVFLKVKNQGMYNFTDNRAHRVKYVVKDAAGNSSQVIFWVKSTPPLPAGRYNPLTHSGKLLKCSLPNIIEEDGMKLDLPADVLYEDLYFDYSVSPSVPGTYSPIYKLHDDDVPLHTFCDLTITTSGIPASLTGKAVIARVEGKGRYSSKGGKYENGRIKAQIRDFGKYTVVIDTTKPVIKAVNIAPGKKISSQKTIIMKMSDNLTGIRYYRGTLNGRWILMDYDAKSATLTYVADDRLVPGKNTFKMVVRDAVGNEAVYTALLIR